VTGNPCRPSLKERRTVLAYANALAHVSGL